MLEQARNTLQMEADAILELVPRVDEHFSAAVAMILDCPGRVVITGMGKSGIIGRKMAATFASTGTPSFYLILPKVFTVIWVGNRKRCRDRSV